MPAIFSCPLTPKMCNVFVIMFERKGEGWGAGGDGGGGGGVYGVKDSGWD